MFECLIACPEWPKCECGDKEDNYYEDDQSIEDSDEFLISDDTWFYEEE